MKLKLLFSALFIISLWTMPVNAKNEKRQVASFSEISLRVSGKLYVRQGDTQSVEVVAKESALDELVTEVKDRELIIRFKSRNLLMSSFSPGRVEIYVTVPEIDGLSVSGSGDIIAKGDIESRILDLMVSGSGNIELKELSTERLKGVISGSGDIIIGEEGTTDDLKIAISGSGDFIAEELEADNVDVKIAGSGDCTIYTDGTLKARIAGSGDIKYRGNPDIDYSVAGSGSVKKY